MVSQIRIVVNSTMRHRSRTISRLALLSLVAYLPLLATVAAAGSITAGDVSCESCLQASGEKSALAREGSDDCCCNQPVSRDRSDSDDCPCPNCPGNECCFCAFCAKCLAPPAALSAEPLSFELNPVERPNGIPDSPCFRLLRPPRTA